MEDEADPVTEILRAEGERRYLQPWRTRPGETMADLVAWMREEAEHQARFYEKLRFAQVDEYARNLKRGIMDQPHPTNSVGEGPCSAA